MRDIYFLTVLQAESAKSECQHDHSGSVRVLFCIADSLYSHIAENREQ